MQIVFSPIELTQVPAKGSSYLDQFISWILGGYNVIGTFIDLGMVKTLIPIVIVIANLDKVWSFIMFILRKIPFIGVE